MFSATFVVVVCVVVEVEESQGELDTGGSTTKHSGNLQGGGLSR